MSTQPAAASPRRPYVELGPSSPVVNNRSLQAEADEVCLFSDDVWDLKPFAGKTTLTTTRIRFDTIPAAFRDAVKRVMWCTVNLETPIELLERPTASRTKVSAGSAVTIFATALRPFTRWLEEQDLTDFAAVDAATLDRYAQHVTAEPVSRAIRQQRLFGVTRIWLMAPYLPEADRLTQPPWERQGLDDLLGPANWSAENKTPPVHPQTMSPLLVWALRFVEDFSDDILRAAAERERLDSRVGTVTGAEATRLITEYFADHVQANRPLPGSFTKGRVGFATGYVAGILGVPKGSLSPRRPAGLRVEQGTPLDVDVHGAIAGTAWTDSLHYHDVPELRRMLFAACLIVVAYLSGMRGEEVRALERGCCRPLPSKDAKPDSYVVVGLSFKDAVDSEGNAIRGGEIREQPWHVVSMVAQAIRVLERLHTEDLLFAVRPFSGRKDDEGKVISTSYAKRLFSNFIDHTNRLADSLNRSHELTPDDPDGHVVLDRFRRTLAWFIYRLPAGRIALGVQYGHLRGYTSDGYGSRVSTGLRDVFPMEEAYAMADTLSDAADRLADGEQVSGPAAGRLVAGLEHYEATFQGQYLSPSQAAKLRRNPQLRIYDNDEQMLMCVHDATKALCHPENQRTPNVATSPDLTRCVEGCANGSRFDSHIAKLKERQAWEQQQADAKATPEPLRQRHLQSIAAMQLIVDDHEATRLQAASLGADPHEGEHESGTDHNSATAIDDGQQ